MPRRSRKLSRRPSSLNTTPLAVTCHGTKGVGQEVDGNSVLFGCRHKNLAEEQSLGLKNITRCSLFCLSQRPCRESDEIKDHLALLVLTWSYEEPS